MRAMCIKNLCWKPKSTAKASYNWLVTLCGCKSQLLSQILDEKFSTNTVLLYCLSLKLNLLNISGVYSYTSLNMLKSQTNFHIYAWMIQKCTVHMHSTVHAQLGGGLVSGNNAIKLILLILYCIYRTNPIAPPTWIGHAILGSSRTEPHWLLNNHKM